MREGQARAVWALWILLLLAIIITIIIRPDLTDPDKLSHLLQRNQDTTLLLYSALIMIRTLTLFPLTPFIFAGAIIWSGQPFIPILLCWISGQIASIVHYHFPHWLGMDAWAKRKYPTRYQQVHQKVKEKGFWYVLLISMIPIMPQELIYYVAGVTRMSFWPFQIAIAISHAIIISIYILGIAEIV